MQNQKILDEIKKMLLNEYNLDEEYIHRIEVDEMLFQEDMGWDSMDFIDFLSKLEERFHIKIPYDQLKHFKSLSGTVDYIKQAIESDKGV